MEAHDIHRHSLLRSAAAAHHKRMTGWPWLILCGALCGASAAPNAGTASAEAVATSVRVHVLAYKTSRDAIAYLGAPLHNATVCIDPPPFGKLPGAQCTLHSKDAVAACLSVPGCGRFVCPDPSAYKVGKKGIHGPICQLREATGRDEKNHAMCKPGGCGRAVVGAAATLTDALAVQAGFRGAAAAAAAAAAANRGGALLAVPGEFPPWLLSENQMEALPGARNHTAVRLMVLHKHHKGGTREQRKRKKPFAMKAGKKGRSPPLGGARRSLRS